jgi:hypothetical protein
MTILLASASVVRMNGRQIPIACIQCWDTRDDGQWTCPKHVEYFVKWIWEIMHLVGFHYTNISRCTVLWLSNTLHYTSYRVKIIKTLYKPSIPSDVMRPSSYKRWESKLADIVKYVFLSNIIYLSSYNKHALHFKLIFATRAGASNSDDETWC